MIVNYTFRRFLKTIIIGFIASMFFYLEARTFYTFSNGKSFTYWNIDLATLFRTQKDKIL